MDYKFKREELENMAFIINAICKGLLNLYATEDRRHDMIADLERMCGQWESTASNTKFVIYKENNGYKLLFIKKKGLFRKLEMETYLIYRNSGWPYINTGTFLVEPQHLVYYHDNDTILFHCDEIYKRSVSCDTAEPEPLDINMQNDGQPQ